MAKNIKPITKIAPLKCGSYFVHVPKVNIEYCQEDILNLSSSQWMRSTNANLIYFLHGGTFGNVNEEDFFASINKVATVGDKLILGVNCFDESVLADPEAFE